jgi:hypothetical protein
MRPYPRAVGLSVSRRESGAALQLVASHGWGTRLGVWTRHAPPRPDTFLSPRAQGPGVGVSYNELAVDKGNAACRALQALYTSGC